MEVDLPLMGSHELGYDGEAEASAVRLAGNEGIEQSATYLRRDSRSIVLHANFKRCHLGVAIILPGMVTIGRRDDHFATLIFARSGSLSAILHEIEEDLDQLILIPTGKRKRRVVGSPEGYVFPDPIGNQGTHAIEHPVYIHRP